MGKEIERKFLVTNDTWKELSVDSHEIVQAYLSHRKEAIVRLRCMDNNAFITIKGLTSDIERNEWEYSISYDDAIEMIESGMCEGEILYKTRHIVTYRNKTWEIDVFKGNLSGLILAEIELDNKNEIIDMPPFIGEEVSNNPAYFNSNLSAKLLSSL